MSAKIDLYAGRPPEVGAHAELPLAAAELEVLTRITADHLGMEGSFPARPDGGVMAPSWVELFAGLGESGARGVARRWMQDRDPEAALDPERVDAAVAMVREIADVCRVARACSLPVVLAVA